MKDNKVADKEKKALVSIEDSEKKDNKKLKMVNMMSKILVADDSLFMRKLIGKILREQGHTIIGEAGSGEAAVEQYAKLRPDLVTMDIVMPGVNGLTALKKIIQLDPLAKVVMVTSLDQEPLAIEAVKNGASDFVIKPFKVDQVIKAVEKVLSLSD